MVEGGSTLVEIQEMGLRGKQAPYPSQGRSRDPREKLGEADCGDGPSPVSKPTCSFQNKPSSCAPCPSPWPCVLIPKMKRKP